MMDFPDIAPSSRSYDDGDWPIKTHVSLDGYTTRILYGSKQTGMTLGLEYSNLPDTQSRLFLEHFRQQKGTFMWFQFPAYNWGPQKGWDGENADFGVSSRGNKWRYAGPPKIKSVYPGVSSVSISLVAVLI